MRIQTIFAENMKKYRKEAKLTQEKLAELCNTDHRYIGQIETGNRCPSLEYVERISSALNVAPCLLFYDGNENAGVADLSMEQKQKIKAMLFDSFSKMCNLIDGNMPER